MIKVMKKNGTKVQAYRLGEVSDMELKLIGAGKIVKHENGSYELFSQEAVHGRGEIAEAGDYFKVDSAGYPYPNKAWFFEKNHVHIENDEYIQNPKILEAWTANEPLCEEIEYLIQHKGLKINPEDKEKYFGAYLWGSYLTAAQDAVLIFYDIKRDEMGKIDDVDFNFVERNEFERIYDIAGE